MINRLRCRRWIGNRLVASAGDSLAIAAENFAVTEPSAIIHPGLCDRESIIIEARANRGIAIAEIRIVAFAVSRATMRRAASHGRPHDAVARARVCVSLANVVFIRRTHTVKSLDSNCRACHVVVVWVELGDLKVRVWLVDTATALFV